MLAKIEDLMDTLLNVQLAFSASHYPKVRPNPIHTTEAVVINEYLPRFGKFVDVGTGFGIMPEVFHLLGAQVISIDFPQTGGTGALQRLMDLGIKGHYAEVGRERLQIEDSSIDVVFAGNVIEHLPHSPRPFLAELKRILRPGGHLVVDTINAVDLRRRIKLLCGVSNWPPIEYIYPLDYHHDHHKEYTLGELRAALSLSGFHLVRALAFEAFFRTPLRASALRYLRRSMRTMTARETESIFADRFQPTNPLEYARIAMLGLVKLFPNLRSDILVVGRKP
jgi:2-polyprenyl-3-methyl-5-hydroxy-6-metoxy-1,4-benzoquinol methylase